jgi:hypothetical protein
MFVLEMMELGIDKKNIFRGRVVSAWQSCDDEKKRRKTTWPTSV